MYSKKTLFWKNPLKGGKWHFLNSPHTYRLLPDYWPGRVGSERYILRGGVWFPQDIDLIAIGVFDWKLCAIKHQQIDQFVIVFILVVTFPVHSNVWIEDVGGNGEIKIRVAKDLQLSLRLTAASGDHGQKQRFSNVATFKLKSGLQLPESHSQLG